MWRKLSRLTAVALVVLLTTPGLCSADTLSIANMVDLVAGVVPNAINSNGVVVGQNASGQAFVYQNGTMTVLPTLGGTGGAANGINASGEVVGWSYTATGLKHAFSWTSAGGIVDLSSGQTYSSSAASVNGSGTLVGWISNGTVTRSAEWSKSGSLTPLFGTSTNHEALGIDNSGGRGCGCSAWFQRSAGSRLLLEWQ